MTESFSFDGLNVETRGQKSNLEIQTEKCVVSRKEEWMISDDEPSNTDKFSFGFSKDEGGKILLI